MPTNPLQYGTSSGSPVSAYSGTSGGTSSGNAVGYLNYWPWTSTNYTNPYVPSAYTYTTPAATTPTGYYDYFQGMTPEEQTAYIDYWGNVGLASSELAIQAQQQAQSQAQQNAQWLAEYQQGQYTDQAAIDLANQQQAWTEYWTPQQQQNEIAAQAALQNQMVGWYTTEQQNQLAYDREALAAQLKSDAENAALSAWGRRTRPNARYL